MIPKCIEYIRVLFLKVVLAKLLLFWLISGLLKLYELYLIAPLSLNAKYCLSFMVTIIGSIVPKHRKKALLRVKL